MNPIFTGPLSPIPPEMVASKENKKCCSMFGNKLKDVERSCSSQAFL